MSAIDRHAQAACMVLLLSSASSASSQHLQLAQRDEAYCRSMASQIQSMRNDYNAQCSGSLSPQQAARCNSMRQQLQDRISRYNSQCG